MLITSPVIGFDLDGVILNHTAMKQHIAKQFGFDLNQSETSSEMMYKMIPLEIWHKIQNLLYDNPEFCLKSPVADGAIETLDRLRREKKPFFLISRRKKSEPAIDILRHHKLWPTYFNDENTFFVRQAEDKNIEARRLGITHYIDDEMRVLERLADVPKKFLFDPLKSNKSPHPYTVISSWAELHRHLFKD